jgi:hypothetical protein
MKPHLGPGLPTRLHVDLDDLLGLRRLPARVQNFPRDLELFGNALVQVLERKRDCFDDLVSGKI